MKNKYLAILLFIFATLSVAAQTSPADQINGVWLDENKDGKIEIFRTGNTYSGKLLWGKDVLDENGKPRHDIYNPDPKLHDRVLQGMVILSGLVYDDGKWKNGKIYDPLKGKWYNVIVTIKDNNLQLRGYVGISLLGSTTVWQRVAEAN